MGLFNKKTKNLSNTITRGYFSVKGSSEPTHIEKEIQDRFLEKMNEPKWEWVEGFKATDSDMKCKEYQFTLGETFTHEGAIELCHSGFHFSSELKNVFDYYSLNGENRFFAVKALVDISKKSNDVLYRKGVDSYSFSSPYNDKKVAKSIIFERELNYGDLKQHISDRFPFIETEGEYQTGLSDYKKFSHSKFIREMEKIGIGELFSTILLKKIDGYQGRYLLLQNAKALASENISKDMLVYFILEESKNGKNK